MSTLVTGSEVNPFLDPLRFDKRAPECLVVIFGASGDLTKRKLLPALYNLARDRRLSTGFAVLGISRTPLSDDDFRARMKDAVAQFSESGPLDTGVWEGFEQGLYYLPGNFADGEFYKLLAARLGEIATARGTSGNVLFYLSTQPSFYPAIVERLGEAGLDGKSGQGWQRVIIEKPFGEDLASARELNQRIHRVFDESEIYRIDHYLGKETVQNILAFRFANGIFEPLWNRRYIRQVQITAAESIGVEGRGVFYEEVGALRDMVQTHLLQVMATVAMEPPARFDAASTRDEKAKALRSIRPLRHDEVATRAVAGQYGPARLGGRDLAGYRQEAGVKPDSQIETYVAATFFVDNWRWAGVPFYLRTGKHLPKRVTEIAIHFASAPHSLFPEAAETAPNLMILRIQPEEGISLKFHSKQPGSGMQLRAVSMDFNYGSSFGVRSPSAYETLLLDAINGDATLYTRQDMVEASWAAVQPVMEVWKNTRFRFPNYPVGSWGPAEADEMLARNGHQWRTP
ncbi:MAG TPA: glucose-6-phosphate dehydrogenase [Bryobacterales bacterium]|nr:glucose-6-phosphate dehydrogenase [Bryobacterales bacterium]